MMGARLTTVHSGVNDMLLGPADRFSFSARGAAAACLALPLWLPGMRASAAAEPPTSWEPGAEIALNGLHVSLSRPVLVARSHDYLWFPTMTRLSGGELLAEFSTNLDALVLDRTAAFSWSDD